jgi:outer membrane biogenesis lipoprotein LolB
MINRNKVFFLSILLLILISCSKDDSAPNQNEDPGTQIQKSAKRGLAYDMKESADFEALKSGVSWWYNWYYSTSAPADYYSNY